MYLDSYFIKTLTVVIRSLGNKRPASKLTNKKVKISSKPLPKGDALRSSADSSVLKETGWNSEIGIKKGLASTWKYFNN